MSKKKYPNPNIARPLQIRPTLKSHHFDFMVGMISEESIFDISDFTNTSIRKWEEQLALPHGGIDSVEGKKFINDIREKGRAIIKSKTTVKDKVQKILKKRKRKIQSRNSV